MVAVCEKYGQEDNLVFSTDPTPALSKTKYMFFCGSTGDVKYPEPVRFDVKDLSWVEPDHLGDTLHQSVTMEMDSIEQEPNSSRKLLMSENSSHLPNQSSSSRWLRFSAVMDMAACSGSYSLTKPNSSSKAGTLL